MTVRPLSALASVALLSAVLVLAAPGAMAQKEDLAGLGQGFRGLAWGTRLADLPGMRRVATGDRSARSHVLLHDDPVFAGVRVTRILYGFFDGALFKVTLETADEQAAAALARTFFTAFGPPTGNASEGFNDVSVWTLKDVEIRCPAKEFDGPSKTVIAFRPLLLRMQARDN